MYRVAVESVLGFRIWKGDTLVLRPCIPASWSGFRVRYRLPDQETVYEIEVRNPDGCETGLAWATVDDEPCPVKGDTVEIGLELDDCCHVVVVAMGAEGV